jgi:hypothetical protein
MADKQFKIWKLGKKLRNRKHIVFGYIWQDPEMNSVSRTCEIIKER